MSSGWAFERQAARRAILFADLVESVRLFKRDEARTFERWDRYVALVAHEIAPAHGGRLVRVAGDGLLLDFANPTSAAKAAFVLHRRVAEFNDAGEDTCFVLRVGLHVAEVARRHNDLWGSGVNLAQRLSTLALPGGTVASATFRGELGDGVHADIHDMGQRVVKHLAEPLRAFALSPPGEAAAVRLPSTEDLRPAVAVVPFVAMPADPEHDALGHAMADDIIASLSRHPGLRVLSRTSTAALRGEAVPPHRLRELLGASFLLSGRFYVRGTQVRLNAELCELSSGQVLWAEALGTDADALFAGQDNVVPRLVARVSEQVMAHELGRVRSLPMDTLSSYTLYLGAAGLLDSLIERDFDVARELLDHLAERHPRQAAPHALLATWGIYRVVQGWAPEPHEEARRSSEHAQIALERDPTLPSALVAYGVSQVMERRDFASAERCYEQALRHDPNCASAWARLSECQSQAGRHEEAVRSALLAVALAPLDPQRFVYESYAARAAFVAKQYAQAVELARASVRRHALHPPAHRLLVAALWLGGQAEAAHEAVRQMLLVLPSSRAGDGPSASGAPGERTPFIQALIDAGLPA